MNTYVIIPIDELTAAMFEAAVEKDADHLRRNNANTHCVMKFSGDTPECFEGYDTYSLSEILVLLQTEAWAEETP